MATTSPDQRATAVAQQQRSDPDSLVLNIASHPPPSMDTTDPPQRPPPSMDTTLLDMCNEIEMADQQQNTAPLTPILTSRPTSRFKVVLGMKATLALVVLQVAAGGLLQGSGGISKTTLPLELIGWILMASLLISIFSSLVNIMVAITLLATLEDDNDISSGPYQDAWLLGMSNISFRTFTTTMLLAAILQGYIRGTS